jgi:hypothetical protein
VVIHLWPDFPYDNYTLYEWHEREQCKKRNEWDDFEEEDEDWEDEEFE